MIEEVDAALSHAVHGLSIMRELVASEHPDGDPTTSGPCPTLIRH